MFRTAPAYLAVALAGLFSPSVYATDVIMRTSLGDIPVELFDEEAPATVANFLSYVRDGSFDDVVVHRLEPGFVIQAGGYKVIDGVINVGPIKDPVQNEPGISNTRGTLSMAKLQGDPDSATNQWFINLADNEDLDSQNGGFAVFGRVTGDGMQVVDAIGDLQRWNLNAAGFTSTPLIDFDGTGSLGLDNFVILDVDEVVDFPVNPGLNDAWYQPSTDGQGLFFTVYPDGGTLFLSWFTFEVERPGEDVTAVIGDPGHRWITAQGPFEGNRAELSATITRGGVFDSASPSPVNDLDVGTLVVEFAGCDRALVNYAFPELGLHGTVVVERVVADNIALCEVLADAAESD